MPSTRYAGATAVTNGLLALFINLESCISLFPLRFSRNFYRLSLTAGIAPPRNLKNAIGDARLVASLPAGEACSWEHMVLEANVLGKLSVTSETYRAIYGTQRRIDGTTTMGRLTAIVQVSLLDGSWGSAASSETVLES